MTEFRLKGGCTLPNHNHPQEQTGYLVSGHIKLNISGSEYDVREGGAWVIPPGAEHGASIVEDSIAIEVFSPVRENYL